jgi:L-methionine (R)-S-oxide reductase
MEAIQEPVDYQAVLAKIVAENHKAQARDEFLSAVCRLLKDSFSYYDWVGYYLLDPHAERQLVLGPYQGEPTEHVRIGFGQGICGQAAEQGHTWIVPDVRRESNYLSCSVHVRSEIVVPILKDGRVVGELDIDSCTLDAFGPADRSLLESAAEISAKWL